MNSPAPSEILAARQSLGEMPVGCGQAQAAALVHVSPRTWRQWEAGERRMPAGLWELFLIKATRGS